jgi:hypothetical protein
VKIKQKKQSQKACGVCKQKHNKDGVGISEGALSIKRVNVLGLQESNY